MDGIKGKVSLVTGGATLIGAAVVRAFQREGAVVNFGSISAKVAQTGRWLYPVTKAAILQLTRNEAMDPAADKIRVNSVSPGWTWCRLMDDITHGDKAKTNRVGGPFHLLGRIGEP